MPRAHRFRSGAPHREREAQAACGPGLRWGNSHRGATSVTSPGAAISPQPPGAPLAHASAERPRKSSYSVTMDLLQRISIDPAVRFGKPCVRGTRLTVGDVLGVLAAGRAEAELLLDFPQLTHECSGLSRFCGGAQRRCRQASVSSPQLLMERFPSSTHGRPPRGPGPGDQR